ncbi:MAG: response regulator transcription factor [Acidobacteriota bacterium]|nr:response regulator transcription factor [Acidobacteriota bacterium]
MIRILIADDQELLREGLAMVLEAQPDMEIVGHAGDGTAAVAAAARLDPDVILMDIRMPNLDGVEATRQITAARPAGQGPRIVVLTTFDLDEYVVSALQAGASGFLLKDAAPADIISAVRAVAAGNALLAPTVTRRLIDRVLARGEVAGLAPPAGLDELTGREREVMALVVDGLSNPEIAASLFLSEATVKTHVGRILAKLGVRDRVQLVILAYEHRLVPREPS